jgi:hypothetical protein
LRLGYIASHITQAGAAKKGRIEGRSQSQRRPPVSRSRTALVKKTRGSDVTRLKAGVAPC